MPALVESTPRGPKHSFHVLLLCQGVKVAELECVPLLHHPGFAHAYDGFSYLLSENCLVGLIAELQEHVALLGRWRAQEGHFAGLKDHIRTEFIQNLQHTSAPG